jgi:metal-responsive CopG/Arc/MetJ family transcriptional regulator
MTARQISITLDEELLAFLDRSGSNRSAAIAEAYAALHEAELSSLPA